MKKLMLSLVLFLTSTQLFAFGGTDSCPEDCICLGSYYMCFDDDCSGEGDKCVSIGDLTTGVGCTGFESGNAACDIPDQ